MPTEPGWGLNLKIIGAGNEPPLVVPVGTGGIAEGIAQIKIARFPLANRMPFSKLPNA